MQKSKIEKTGEFIAIGTDGNSYHVIEYTNFINATTIHDTQEQWIPGMKEYRLPNNDPVNNISSNTFEIVRTGLRIERT